jgi:hypothetical protein
VVGVVKDYSDSLLTLLLKVRNPAVFNRPQESISNVNVRVTRAEAIARIKRLGLPMPIVETDYEEDDVDDRLEKE